MQQVLQRTRQPVELPDHHHVTWAEVIEQAVQLRTVPSAAGMSEDEQPFSVM